MILEKWWGLSSGKLALSVARGQHGGVSSPEACGAQQVAHLPLTSHWDRMDWCLMMPFCRQDLCSQGLQGCFFDWGSSVNFTDCDAQVPILRYWTLPGLPKKRTLCLVPKETSPHKKEEGVPGPGIWTLKEMQKLRFSWQSFFFEVDIGHAIMPHIICSKTFFEVIFEAPFFLATSGQAGPGREQTRLFGCQAIRHPEI